MYGITGAFRQYCFDRAVMTFGLALEAELDSLEGKTSKEVNAKRERLLNKWLDRPQRYRQPVASTPAGPTASTDVEQTFTVSGDISEG